MNNDDKEKILDAIRENLAASKYEGTAADEALPQPRSAPDSASLDQPSLMEQFAGELTALGGRIFVAKNSGEARTYIKDLLQKLNARLVATSASPLLASLNLDSLLLDTGSELLPTSPHAAAHELADYKQRLMSADVGITAAESGLAESGTIVLRTNDKEGRLASLVPPVHLAVIRKDQILPGLTDFIARCETPLTSSDVIFITGPSRTADIELTLIVGMHGPGQLHVIILD